MVGNVLGDKKRCVLCREFPLTTYYSSDLIKSSFQCELFPYQLYCLFVDLYTVSATASPSQPLLPVTLSMFCLKFQLSCARLLR